MDYDLIVIGSGPGGYHAAIRAAQVGLKVACVEKADVGGVCLNIGCIPTKALLHVAHTLEASQQASEFGVDYGEPNVDLKKLESWKAGVVKKLTGGVRQLLKGNKVDVIEGEAKFVEPHAITVGDRKITADKFIVATGSRPVSLPGFEVDGDRIVDSTGALLVAEVPKRFMALGGSAIGLEFAQIYAALGSEVTVVELLDRIAPTADVDASKVLHKVLAKRGLQLKTGMKALSQKKTKAGTEIEIE